MIRIKKPQEIAESSVTHAFYPQSQHTTKIYLDLFFKSNSDTEDRQNIYKSWLAVIASPPCLTKFLYF